MMEFHETCPNCGAEFKFLESVSAYGTTMQFCNRCATRWVIDGEDTPEQRDKVQAVLLASRGPEVTIACEKCQASSQMPKAMMDDPGAALLCPRCGHVSSGQRKGRADSPHNLPTPRNLMSDHVPRDPMSSPIARPTDGWPHLAATIAGTTASG